LSQAPHRLPVALGLVALHVSEVLFVLVDRRVDRDDRAPVEPPPDVVSDLARLFVRFHDERTARALGCNEGELPPVAEGVGPVDGANPVEFHSASPWHACACPASTRSSNLRK